MKNKEKKDFKYNIVEPKKRKKALEKLKAIHLNDSKNDLASHKDRHEKIGEGKIGLEAISKIINNDRIKNLPFYLETPNEIEGYEKEIQLLKKIKND